MPWGRLPRSGEPSGIPADAPPEAGWPARPASPAVLRLREGGGGADGDNDLRRNCMNHFAKIAAELDAAGLDAILLTEEANRFYASGFRSAKPLSWASSRASSKELPSWAILVRI